MGRCERLRCTGCLGQSEADCACGLEQPNANQKVPLERVFKTYKPDPSVDGPPLTYRLYVYDTRIVQEIRFKIEATAEGGASMKSPELILNITCPSYVAVAAPSSVGPPWPLQADPYPSLVTKYVGG